MNKEFERFFEKVVADHMRKYRQGKIEAGQYLYSKVDKIIACNAVPWTGDMGVSPMKLAAETIKELGIKQWVFASEAWMKRFKGGEEAEKEFRKNYKWGDMEKKQLADYEVLFIVGSSHGEKIGRAFEIHRNPNGSIKQFIKMPYDEGIWTSDWI